MSFHIYCSHKGLFMIIHPLAFHCPCHRVDHFRTNQLPIQMVNGQSLCVISSQTTLSSFHWLLHWLLCGRFTWRSTVYTAKIWCSVRVYQVSAPFQSWDPNPRVILPFYCLCHSIWPIPSRVVFLPSQRQLPASIPSPTHAFSLPGGIRDGSIVPDRELNSSKALKPLAPY